MAFLLRGNQMIKTGAIFNVNISIVGRLKKRLMFSSKYMAECNYVGEDSLRHCLRNESDALWAIKALIYIVRNL